MKLSGKDPIKLRLQVFLSRNGVCSRRRAFDMVKEGHVRLNGKVCREPSTPVDPEKDQIDVDGSHIQGKTYDYILMNKPAGYTATKSDRFAEKTILELLPDHLHHLAPVGRLDKDTEGLLLLTNDGDAAYCLTHPKFNIDKTYMVRISGKLESKAKKNLEEGVTVEGKRTSPSSIKNLGIQNNRTELTITIHEGRKRQIRMMFAAVGHRVVYLKRLVQGPITLGTLKTGGWRKLTQQEISKIKKI